MTDNSELEAAIAAGFISPFLAMHVNKQEELSDATEAFAAYRDRFHALEAENARLREALRQIHNNAPTREPIQPHPQNYPQAHSFWIAGQLAAAVLADSEGK